MHEIDETSYRLGASEAMYQVLQAIGLAMEEQEITHSTILTLEEKFIDILKDYE